MMCTANIPLERFFLFPFLLFIRILFCIYLAPTFRPGFELDHLCNEFTFCMWLFMMYTYIGNIYERGSVGWFLGQAFMPLIFILWVPGYDDL